jgi:hypothetical protein
MPQMEQFAVVALLRDKPEEGLARGQVGTVMETLADGVYLVDFSDDEGRTYALATLRAEDFMPLHHRRLEQVA